MGPLAFFKSRLAARQQGKLAKFDANCIDELIIDGDDKYSIVCNGNPIIIVENTCSSVNSNDEEDEKKLANFLAEQENSQENSQVPLSKEEIDTQFRELEAQVDNENPRHAIDFSYDDVYRMILKQREVSSKTHRVLLLEKYEFLGEDEEYKRLLKAISIEPDVNLLERSLLKDYKLAIDELTNELNKI